MVDVLHSLYCSGGRDGFEGLDEEIFKSAINSAIAPLSCWRLIDCFEQTFEPFGEYIGVDVVRRTIIPE